MPGIVVEHLRRLHDLNEDAIRAGDSSSGYRKGLACTTLAREILKVPAPEALETIPLRYRFEYALYRAVRSIVGALPVRQRVWLGRSCGRIGYYLDSRHRRVALGNIAHAMPELSDSERKRTIRRAFENFVSLAVTTLAATHLSKEELLQNFEVEGWHHFERAEARKRGVIILTAHLGDWEGLAQFLALRERPISFVARPLDNPLLEGDFRRVRERLGNKTIFKRRGARKMLTTLRSGGRLGFLLDQRVHPHEGKAYPFLGRPAFTSPLPARLSLRTGASVVPFFAIPVDNWRRCRIVVLPAIESDPSLPESEEVDRLTLGYLKVIEEAIRKNPELWLWMHRRWRWQPDADFQSVAGLKTSTEPDTKESEAEPVASGRSA